MADSFTDFMIQLSLLIIGSFIGALVAYFFPKILGWKGDYRIEKINYFSNLLENCYGSPLV
ncbi:MAG: hypothetical protein ACFFDN_18555 [Candidatus Hodarchaeota archaeon]